MHCWVKMEKLTEDRKKAERLNVHSSSVFPPQKRTGPSRNVSREDMVSMLLVDIDREVIEKHRAALSEYGFPEPDGMHSRVLKELLESLQGFYPSSSIHLGG